MRVGFLRAHTAVVLFPNLTGWQTRSASLWKEPRECQVETQRSVPSFPHASVVCPFSHKNADLVLLASRKVSPWFVLSRQLQIEVCEHISDVPTKSRACKKSVLETSNSLVKLQNWFFYLLVRLPGLLIAWLPSAVSGINRVWGSFVQRCV